MIFLLIKTCADELKMHIFIQCKYIKKRRIIFACNKWLILKNQIYHSHSTDVRVSYLHTIVIVVVVVVIVIVVENVVESKRR